MKTISKEVLREIVKVYQLEEFHQEIRAKHEESGEEKGWLQVVFACTAATVGATDLIQDFGGDRKFIHALGAYLISNNLVPKPPKKKGSSEPDFIDQLQERVV